MQPFPSAGVDVFVRSRRPWGKVAADFFVHKGHSYLFVVVYYYHDVRYSYCRNRARVDIGLSVGISVTVSVPSNKVRVVIVLTKNVVKIISLVL